MRANSTIIRITSLAGLWVLASIISGCDSWHREEALSLPPMGRIVGTSLDERSIHARVMQRDIANPTVMFIASIHGNESAGTALIHRLKDWLDEHSSVLERRSVVLIAVANPDGVANRDRRNRNGVDLNRNFPADNWVVSDDNGPSALSEPESRAIAAMIQEHQPSWIVTLHEPFACVDYDGPGLPLAKAMSKACGLPVRKLGSRPGSLGSFAGETLGIATITLELPPFARRQPIDKRWDTYGPALIAALEFSPQSPGYRRRSHSLGIVPK